MKSFDMMIDDFLCEKGLEKNSLEGACKILVEDDEATQARGLRAGGRRLMRNSLGAWNWGDWKRGRGGHLD